MPPALNHVFVDFENVHEIDFTVLSNRPATFTILVGAKQTRMDMKLVEEMMRHAGAVHLIRLTSSGKNALDFTLAYYVGRAAAVDPSAYFHIISKDTGFDPLVEHLRSHQVHIRRHADFSSLTFSHPSKSQQQSPIHAAHSGPPSAHSGPSSASSANPAPKPAKPSSPVSKSSTPTAKNPAISAKAATHSSSTASPSSSATRTAGIPNSPTATPDHPEATSASHPESPLDRALAHLRRNPNNRPKRKKTLLSHLRSLLGKSANETDAAALLRNLEKRHLSIDAKDSVKYHL
ncbi:MAG: hypothetical protein JWL81_914 [Verrucomicrobiales bacterium]|nr:hypothetical protein [Verrucomicrobiales bacterium]